MQQERKTLVAGLEPVAAETGKYCRLLHIQNQEMRASAAAVGLSAAMVDTGNCSVAEWHCGGCLQTLWVRGQWMLG